MIKKKIVLKKKTEHGTIRVMDTVEDGEKLRYLLVGKTIESAMYLDPERKNDLLFPYLRCLEYPMSLKEGLRRTYLIGSGAFAYPKYYVQNYPGSYLKTAEISPDTIEVSREYFGLCEIEDKIDLICGDGFAALKEDPERYDYIINDAFLGDRHAGHTAEDTRVIREHLTEDGIYVTNVVSSMTGFHSHRLRKFEERIRKEFAYIQTMQCEEERNPKERQNLLVLAKTKPFFREE